MARGKKAAESDASEQSSGGRLSLKEMMKLVNKKAGTNVAFDLKDDNPSEVTDWIPTGSRWLDSIVCRAKLGGIPVTRISELAGLESCVTEDTMVELLVEEQPIKCRIQNVKSLLETAKSVKVKTKGGEYTKVTNYVEKGPQGTFLIVLVNGNSIKTSAIHRCYSREGWKETRDLVSGKTELLCDDGQYWTVESVESIGERNIVDITVEHPEHCYYGNGILNHNTGKSYIAAQIAANAQKKGVDVVYFDSESAIDPKFLVNAGCDLEHILYIQAKSCEFVLGTIEELLGSNTGHMLFIWDSLAFTPTESDIEGDFDPQSSMSVKARVLGKGLPKLIQPLANHGSTLLVLNQLKTRIPQSHFERAEIMAEPYFTPGGKAASYAYSLRIWLTDRKGKDSFVTDDKGYRIGTEVKATIKKSRFGTQGRFCKFKILWGTDDVSVCDEESWMEAIQDSDYITTGTFWTMKMADGSERKFRSSNWLEELKDPAFKQRVFEIMEEHVIRNFDTRQGSAGAYYRDAEDTHDDADEECDK